MQERKNLNKLLVSTLSVSTTPPRASELYYQIREENPSIFREESVKGFRSFVKIINSFTEIEGVGTGIKCYILK